ncbi:MAG: hypothetical protein ACLP0J_08345 [Solirubrobacteraceae bacterium]
MTAVANLVLNGAIAWVSTLGHNTVPLWGSPAAGPSLIVDTCLTLFFLPLLACPLITAAVHNERRRGTLPGLSLTGSTHALATVVPRNRFLRAVAFGAATAAFLAPPIIAILMAIDPARLPVSDFVSFKASFAVALGALVTPVMALCAMADPI